MNKSTAKSTFPGELRKECEPPRRGQPAKSPVSSSCFRSDRTSRKRRPFPRRYHRGLETAAVFRRLASSAIATDHRCRRRFFSRDARGRRSRLARPPQPVRPALQISRSPERPLRVAAKDRFAGVFAFAMNRCGGFTGSRNRAARGRARREPWSSSSTTSRIRRLGVGLLSRVAFGPRSAAAALFLRMAVHRGAFDFEAHLEIIL